MMAPLRLAHGPPPPSLLALGYAFMGLTEKRATAVKERGRERGHKSHTGDYAIEGRMDRLPFRRDLHSLEIDLHTWTVHRPPSSAPPKIPDLIKIKKVWHPIVSLPKLITLGSLDMAFKGKRDWGSAVQWGR